MAAMRLSLLEEVLRLFGDEQVADGRSVRDVLKVLPAKSSYENLDVMTAEIGEREAAIVRTTMGAQSAVSAALGIEGELAKARPEAVVRLMKEQGVPAEVGDAAEWTAFARTLTKLR